jgi:hypothetical protein
LRGALALHTCRCAPPIAIRAWSKGLENTACHPADPSSARAQARCVPQPHLQLHGVKKMFDVASARRFPVPPTAGGTTGRQDSSPPGAVVGVPRSPRYEWPSSRPLPSLVFSSHLQSTHLAGSPPRSEMLFIRDFRGQDLSFHTLLRGSYVHRGARCRRTAGRIQDLGHDHIRRQRRQVIGLGTLPDHGS